MEKKEGTPLHRPPLRKRLLNAEEINSSGSGITPPPGILSTDSWVKTPTTPHPKTPIRRVNLSSAFGTPSTPIASFLSGAGDSLDSPHRPHPISAAFELLEEFQFGKEEPPVRYSEVLYKPETQFDKIVQKCKQFIYEVSGALNRIKTVEEIEEENVLQIEREVGRTLVEVSNICKHLREYLEEARIQREDGVSSPVSFRVVSCLKSNEAALKELDKMVAEAKKELHFAVAVRDRKDLMEEWSSSPWTRDKAYRRKGGNVEEMITDSTAKLTEMKRRLQEIVTASDGTLDILDSSSQSIKNNEDELGVQAGTVSNAKSILKKYGRRAATDKISMWLAFTFLCFCALLIVYRRLF